MQFSTIGRCYEDLKVLELDKRNLAADRKDYNGLCYGGDDSYGNLCNTLNLEQSIHVKNTILNYLLYKRTAS